MPNELIKIADAVNAKRRQELIDIYDTGDMLKEIAKTRESGEYDKGNKSKSMRKIASIPVEVDIFLTKLYGEDYYKDPSFFKTRFTEWAVVDPKKQ